MLKALQLLVLFLAVAFFLTLAGLAYLSSPPPVHPSEQQTATQTTDKQPQEKQHTFGGLINFLFPDAISIFTFWLVVATIVLGIIAYVQIDFLKRAEGISANIAQAAKDSAEAAKQAVMLSDKTAERQLRGYIYIFPVTLVDFKVGYPIMVALSAKNYGVTPIRNGRVHFGFNITARNPEQDYTVDDDSMIVSKQPIGFPSRGSADAIPLRLASKKDVLDDDFINFSKKGYVVVVKGTFIYDDIFKIERHTHFFMHLSGTNL